MIRDVGLEEIVKDLIDRGSFSHNGAELSLDDYTDAHGLDEDWVYFAAREIEDKREQFGINLRSDLAVNPIRLYRAIPKNHPLKETTNKPYLSHVDYFKLAELIEKNPQKYQNDEGYIQIARDLTDETGSKANLAQVWSGAKKYREKLRWSGVINLPLNDFDTLERLLRDDLQREEGLRLYEGDEGYIQVARDLEDETGSKANLIQIWSGAKKYREELGWSGRIELPLNDFDTLERLLRDDLQREEGLRLYESDEGYIQVARDLEDETGSKANLAHVWSGAKKYREELGWSGKIGIPLNDFDTLERLLRDDLQREEGLRLYAGDEGYIQVARDLEDETGSKANLIQIWSGSRKYREELGWSGIIDLPLNDFDALERLLSDDVQREEGLRLYAGDEGYIQVARDLRDETGSEAHLAHVWSGSKKYREELGWSGMINLPLNDFDALERLLSDDVQREEGLRLYAGDEGYIQVAWDLRDETGSKANLSKVWSGAKKYREELGWSGKIELPLNDFDTLERLLRDDLQREEGLRLYEGDEGYIQVAWDLRDETGSKANLAHVWSGAKKYREELGWSGKIELPLNDFDTLERLLRDDLQREEGLRLYEGDEGYIQVAWDLRDETGSEANLAHVWSGAKKYREELGWSGMINLPLNDFDTLERLLRDDLQREEGLRLYEGDEGYIQVAWDLRDETGSKANLSKVWSGAKKYREELGWKGVIRHTLSYSD